MELDQRGGAGKVSKVCFMGNAEKFNILYLSDQIRFNTKPLILAFVTCHHFLKHSRVREFELFNLRQNSETSIAGKVR